MKPYDKNDPNTIRAMFDSIAKNYDRTNAILSFQMHKRWNDELIKQVILPSQPKSYIDICCGTGAIALEYLKSIDQHRQEESFVQPNVYMLDFSEEMLAYAREKLLDNSLDHYDITFLQADAQHIPLPENYIDCATIAYGIRNVKHPQHCLKEIWRILKKNGTLGILELTQPANPLLRAGHGLYLRTFLPIAGKLLTDNKEAYRYLCNSIHTFIPPKKLSQMMQEAGFSNCRKISLSGGIATIFIGSKHE